MTQTTGTPPYSALYALFRESQVVDRESFTIAIVDPQGGWTNGAIHAEDFVHQILRTLGLCGKQEGTCHREPCQDQPGPDGDR